MKYAMDIEKLPKFVQDAYGNAQKKWTLLEGEARKLMNDTYTRLRKNLSVKTVENAVDQWKSKYTQILDFKPIRKKVVRFRTDLGNRAADTIGVATKSDIRSITRKITKLQSEVRKVTQGEKKQARGSR
jgi:hypothetical protein